MDRETIQLILDMGASGANVDEVRAKMESLRTSVSSAAETYEVLTTVVNRGVGGAGNYEIATDKVNVALDAEVRSAVEATAAHRSLGRVLDETSKAGKNAAGVSRDMQMRILNLGRATQDLAQGGLAGIINNLEGIVGGSGVAAGAITLLGTAILVTKPYWEGWLKQLGELKTKIPESGDKVQDLTESLKKQKEALEELKKQGELNYFDMVKYGKLVAEVSQKEAALAEARLARSVSDHESKGHRERAGAFREQLAEFGGSEKILEVLQNAGLKNKEAEDLVADALKGIKGAAERVQDLTANMPKSSQFHYASPEQKKAREQLERDGEKHHRILQQQEEHEKREADKKAREQEKLADEKRRGDERIAADRKRAQEKAQHDAAAKRHREAEAAGHAHQANLKRAQAAGIDHQALDELTRIHQAGGDTDRYDRFHFMNPAQQERALAQRVERTLRRQFPSMPAGERRVTASHLARDASVQLQQQLLANQQQQASNTAALQAQLQNARRIGQENRRISQQIRQPQVDPGVF